MGVGGIKLIFSINVCDIILYINGVFYCCCACCFIAVAI